MAVVHIPEEEAVRDFGRVLSKAAAGDEILIDHAGAHVRISRIEPAKTKTFAEAIALLDGESPGVMDDDFARDVRSFKERHPESLNSSAWD